MDSLAQAAFCIPHTPVLITKGMQILWNLSLDLQQQFPLDTTVNMLDFCVYAEDILKNDHPYLVVLETLNERIYIHSPLDKQYLAITPYIHGLLSSREYLKLVDLTTHEGRLSLWSHACTQTDLLCRDAAFYATCLKTTVHVPNGNFQIPLPIYFALENHLYVFNSAKDIYSACHWLILNQDKIKDGILKDTALSMSALLLRAEEDISPLHLLPREFSLSPQQQNFAVEYGTTNKINVQSRHLPSHFECEQANLNSGQQYKYPKSTQPRKKGINVIGYGFSDLGIGEDARCALANCDAANISATLYNLHNKITSSSNNRLYASRVDSTLPHCINLYCLPPTEFSRALLSMHPKLRNDRYTILASPWELPHYPKELRPILELVDEFWAPSRFIAKALEEATQKTVLYMPLSVNLPFPSLKTREDFGLPSDAFLFLFIFDWLSWPQRKNPGATIQTFKKAFSKQDNVALVIKTMNAAKNIEQLQELLPLNELGKRYYIINDSLTVHDISALYSCCDAYVSLHRSEGFGRTIAEAMLAKIPVIATNYSGNTDFCSNDTTFLVNGHITPLKEGDYLFWQGQEWCDPSIDEAVEMMRLCAANKTESQHRVLKAFKHISTAHSPGTVGQLYKQRLDTIFKSQLI